MVVTVLVGGRDRCQSKITCGFLQNRDVLLTVLWNHCDGIWNSKVRGKTAKELPAS